MTKYATCILDPGFLLYLPFKRGLRNPSRTRLRWHRDRDVDYDESKRGLVISVGDACSAIASDIGSKSKRFVGHSLANHVAGKRKPLSAALLDQGTSIFLR